MRTIQSKWTSGKFQSKWTKRRYGRLGRAWSQAAEDAVSKWKFASGSSPSTEEVDVTFAPGQ